LDTLKNRAYIGEIASGEETLCADAHEPIIDAETWIRRSACGRASAAVGTAAVPRSGIFWGKRQFAERFRVKAIPGAVGYGFSGSGEGGENPLFADGPFLYIVGYGWLGSAHNSKHSALIDAATKLYARLHGHPAS
jgi:hypothetical protein